MSEKRRLSAMFSVRLTPAELEKVQARADEEQESVSGYLRKLALRDINERARQTSNTEVHDEWAVRWAGDPKMGGGSHVVGLGTTWHTEQEARRAAEILNDRHTGLRIMHRLASDWEIVN